MTLDKLIEELTRLEKEATPGPWMESALEPLYLMQDNDRCDLLAAFGEWDDRGATTTVPRS